jgi:hypothetical protein
MYACADPVGIRHVTNQELTAEKKGRIVDADTQAGISGVKVIVNWRTSSTGMPSGWGNGGSTWCDLQKIVVTDADGNYTIPNVSNELDISDRGTHSKVTPAGVLSVKHDADYALAVFKPGYVRDGDMDIVERGRNYARNNEFSELSLQRTPPSEIHAGKLVLKPIVMRKLDLSWSDLWAYYSWIPLECVDRMSKHIQSPESNVIRNSMRDAVREMPCSMPAHTVITPEDLSAFNSLAHGAADVKFLERVKVSEGIKATTTFDPTEKVSTTAGTLCRLIHEEEAAQ